MTTKECSSMDEKKQPDEQEKDPGLSAADEAIEDLEPETEEGAAVKGGSFGGGGGGNRPPIG
jgi:hypothetical protein